LRLNQDALTALLTLIFPQFEEKLLGSTECLHWASFVRCGIFSLAAPFISFIYIDKLEI
jgi:hypothetical protein